VDARKLSLTLYDSTADMVKLEGRFGFPPLPPEEVRERIERARAMCSEIQIPRSNPTLSALTGRFPSTSPGVRGLDYHLSSGEVAILERVRAIYRHFGYATCPGVETRVVKRVLPAVM
jgi:hypothetical protein